MEFLLNSRGEPKRHGQPTHTSPKMTELTGFMTVKTPITIIARANTYLDPLSTDILALRIRRDIHGLWAPHAAIWRCNIVGKRFGYPAFSNTTQRGSLEGKNVSTVEHNYCRTAVAPLCPLGQRRPNTRNLLHASRWEPETAMLFSLARP